MNEFYNSQPGLLEIHLAEAGAHILLLARQAKPLNSPHEGYAYIKASLDRLWSLILEGKLRGSATTMTAASLSAAAIRYIVDLTSFHPDRTEEERLTMTYAAVTAEVKNAMGKHNALVSMHEAYAVILEEVDELFEEVRPDRGRSLAAQKEATQIAAMGIRCILDTGLI